MVIARPWQPFFFMPTSHKLFCQNPESKYTDTKHRGQELRHEKLASPEEIICEYLKTNPEINNSKAREITFIGSENSVKRIFNKMIKSKMIERIPDRPQARTGYRKGPNFPP